MENTKTNHTHPLQHSATGELIESLLNEHYAVKNDFQNITLEAVGIIIEEARDSYEHPDALSPEFLAEMESFERCKSLYCLILLEFELLNFRDLPSETLSQLKAKQSSETAYIADEEDSMSEKTMLHMGISGAMLESTKESGNQTQTPEPHLEQYEGIQSEEARNYLRFADFLQLASQTKNYSLPFSYLYRFQGQSTCFAIENEITIRLFPSIKIFWGQKKEAIKGVLDQKNNGVEVHPELKKGLEVIATTYPQWLFEAKYPLAGTINSLKYISSVQDIEKFKPAPLDIAVLLLFFGHSGQLGTFELQNRLRISGLLQKEIIELSFRLTRLQKMKAKILSLTNEFNEGDLRLLGEDAKAILVLLAKAFGAGANDLQDVA